MAKKTIDNIFFHNILATFFLAGKLPWCPGTWGSLAGSVLFFSLGGNLGAEILVFVVIFFLGRISAGFLENELNEKDPPSVVIDEVAGIFVTFFMLPRSVTVFIVGFFLFRVIDIVKLPPARRLECLPQGWGVMLDDISAGIYANILLQSALILGII